MDLWNFDTQTENKVQTYTDVLWQWLQSNKNQSLLPFQQHMNQVQVSTRNKLYDTLYSICVADDKQDLWKRIQNFLGKQHLKMLHLNHTKQIHLYSRSETIKEEMHSIPSNFGATMQ